MFYVLRTVDLPFSSTPPETFIVARNVVPSALDDTLNEARHQYPNDTLEAVERVLLIMPGITIRGAEKNIPPELARAVEAWNAIAPRTTPHLPVVKKIEPHIGTYRTWKKRNGNRTVLLESIVAKVEAATWTHPWVTFGWLLGHKGGDENYEKILDDRRRFAKPGRRAAANGEDFEAVER